MAEKIYHLLLIDIIALRGHQSLKRLIYIRSLDRAYLFSPPPWLPFGFGFGFGIGDRDHTKIHYNSNNSNKKLSFCRR